MRKPCQLKHILCIQYVVYIISTVSDRNSVSAETIGRNYQPKLSAETIGIGIGFGAETFSAVTEIALYCISLEFVHFNGLIEQQKKEGYLVKRNSTKLYFTSVCNRALHPQRCLVKGFTSTKSPPPHIVRKATKRFRKSCKSERPWYLAFLAKPRLLAVSQAIWDQYGGIFCIIHTYFILFKAINDPLKWVPYNKKYFRLRH